jgi:phage gp29-like protein
MSIVDQNGNPISASKLREPQTARIAALENQYLTPMISGLTPARLSHILLAADDGDLTSQHRLFADMEERDAHLLCEIGKRKLAVTTIDWDILPPRNATAAEKANAEWVKEVLTDGIDPIEDLLLALMDGVGHGYAGTEIEWRKTGNDLLPTFWPRPQEWFRLSMDRRELHLIDGSADGAPLQPFGWVLHTPGKAKTGYLGRMGLYRALVWPFLYKAYSVGDFAEFLEIYGLPMIIGKYYNGADDAEKASLMRAVVALGHDARAIMPADMSLEINKVVTEGSATPHLSMIDWADRAQSKAILGQTTSSEARGTGLGSGVAQAHADVRQDIRDADARQLASTLTRDIIYPLLALNRGIDSLDRCPRMSFDTSDPDDIKTYADALPKLVGVGLNIKKSWVHEKLKIPQGGDEQDDAVLAIARPDMVVSPELRPEPEADPPPPPEQAKLRAETAASAEPDLYEQIAAEMSGDWERVTAPLVDPIERLMTECRDLEDFRARLPSVLEQMDASALVDGLASATFAARLLGRI